MRLIDRFTLGRRLDENGIPRGAAAGPQRRVERQLSRDVEAARAVPPAGLRERVLARLDASAGTVAPRRAVPLAPILAAAATLVLLFTFRRATPIEERQAAAFDAPKRRAVTLLVPRRGGAGRVDGIAASSELALQLAVDRAVRSELGGFAVDASQTAGAFVHGVLGAPSALRGAAVPR